MKEYICKVHQDWETLGISPVYVVKKISDNSYALVNYLVDFWCLGVKDVFFKVGVTRERLNISLDNQAGLVDISYEDARSLILGAADFAASLGIAPHKSWNGFPSSFIEADKPYAPKFSFGKKGAPCYVAGFYDHEQYDIGEIVAKIQHVQPYAALTL